MALAIEEDPDARPERARNFYLRAVELEPTNATYWLEYAFHLLTLDDRKRGLRALRRAHAAAPDDPVVVGRVADGLRQEGLAEEACTKLRAALFAHPRDRRFRALWQQHQFTLLYERQQAERRTRTAAAIGAPVVLPFTAVEPEGRYASLGAKTLRLDPPGTVNEPKVARQQVRRPL